MWIEYPARGAAAKWQCWKAAELLLWMFPKPYNFASALGRGFRKLRLIAELMEFDLLHRLRCDRPAELGELVCAGMLLIVGCKGSFPTRVLHLDEALLVNAETFDGIRVRVAAFLAELHEE